MSASFLPKAGEQHLCVAQATQATWSNCCPDYLFFSRAFRPNIVGNLWKPPTVSRHHSEMEILYTCDQALCTLPYWTLWRQSTQWVLFITLMLWLLSWCLKCILLLIPSLNILFSFRAERVHSSECHRKVRLTKMVLQASGPECPLALLWKSLCNWGWPWIADPLVCTSWMPWKLPVCITADR